MCHPSFRVLSPFLFWDDRDRGRPDGPFSRLVVTAVFTDTEVQRADAVANRDAANAAHVEAGAPWIVGHRARAFSARVARAVMPRRSIRSRLISFRSSLIAPAALSITSAIS